MTSLFFIIISDQAWYLPLVFSICIFGIVTTVHLGTWVLSRSDGTDVMRKISDPIREGAEGFLRVQYSAIRKVSLVIALTLFGVDVLSGKGLGFALMSSLTFAFGASCSAIAGYLSMWISSQTNIRVASASAKAYSLAFYICFRGGAFSAILSLTLCVSGVMIIYVSLYMFFFLPGFISLYDIPLLMTGFSFGASSVALFMQLGGGIYTKAADVGADLVGKIEIGIPEDDPRNPAVIADLVGDLVGDCVGSSADVFESVSAEIIGAMILGASLVKEAKLENPNSFIFFPLCIHAFDILVSTIGVLSVKIPKIDDENCLKEGSLGMSVNPVIPIKQGYAVSLVLSLFCFIFCSYTLLYVENLPNAWIYFAGCGVVGMLTSYIFMLSTQYYTDYAYAPVKHIAKASTTGPGTNIIIGVGIGFQSVVIPAVTISVAVLLSYFLGSASGIGDGHKAGLFGTAVATMGMLSSAGFILAQNNFGPIADNAGGIVEMSGQPDALRVTTDKLDAAGNVTKAITKGYSVGSAALACFLLFGAFLDEVSINSYNFNVINLAKPTVTVAGLLGMTQIFLITSMAIAAVGKTATKVVEEVRRQLKCSPDILTWNAKPDYKVCVEIVTKAALREMVLPGLIAVFMPVLVGLAFRFIGYLTDSTLLGAEAVGSYMIFATISGILMALFLDNVGGAWDNAKKFIELGNHGGKGSDAHKAAVVGDTVGDPFKDTAGPAIHVVIKLLGNTVLVVAPLFISGTL